jgi:F420-dependent oxidoreductase-like protein
VKLSTILQYASDPRAAAEEIPVLEKAGLDVVWVPEAYSFDAVSTMGYLAALTDHVEIGSGILNVYSRTPTLIAMSLASIDALSGGRANCGLGASGPQVIEGFHGVPYLQPMQRIIETIEVCRATWRREPIEHHGKTIDIPLPAEQGTGLGKALKLINHPVRSAIPIWWASLQPRSVEATARLADGWIPIHFVPDRADAVWGEALARGRQQRLAELQPLQIMAGGAARITEDADEVSRILDAGRPEVALYVGGMGARGKNFYNETMVRYGWESEARTIQDLYLDGRKAEAAAAVPAEYLSAVALVGPIGHVAERVAAYAEAGVTHLQLTLTGPLAQKLATVEAFRSIVDS